MTRTDRQTVANYSQEHATLPGTDGAAVASDATVARHRIVVALLDRPALADAIADPLRPLLASLVAGRMLGQGVLSATLGLASEEFARFWQHYFPGPILPLADGVGSVPMPEREELEAMLLAHVDEPSQRERWAAAIVVAGCAGRDHLWYDLGLANRAELSALLTHAFPRFAVQNTGNMKWKKFLYRYHCQHEGIYVCRSPSCQACSDYAQCFGPEE